MNDDSNVMYKKLESGIEGGINNDEHGTHMREKGCYNETKHYNDNFVGYLLKSDMHTGTRTNANQRLYNKEYIQKIKRLKENKYFGDKTIGKFSSYIYLINQIFGSGIVSIPYVFKSSGWLPCLFMNLFICLLTTLNTLLFLRTMTMIPNNTQFNKRYEYISTVCYFLGKNSIFFLFIQFCFYASIMASNVISIVMVSHAVDNLLIKIFGGTVGFVFYPTFGFRHFTNTTDLYYTENYILCMTIGYVINAIVSIYFSQSNLEDNMKIQFLSFFFLMGTIFQMLYVSIVKIYKYEKATGAVTGAVTGTLATTVTTSMAHSLFTQFGEHYFQTDHFSPSLKNKTPHTISVKSINKYADIKYPTIFGDFNFRQLLSSYIASYSTVTVIPCWANEMKSDVEIIKTVWCSYLFCCFIYYIYGYILCTAYPHVNNDNILNDILQNPLTDMYMKIPIYLFDLLTIAPGIYVYCIATRYNLINSNICSEKLAFLFGTIFPFVISWFFTSSSFFEDICIWSSLIFSFACNFITPSVIYLIACKHIPYSEKNPLKYIHVLYNPKEHNRSRYLYGIFTSRKNETGSNQSTTAITNSRINLSTNTSISQQTSPNRSMIVKMGPSQSPSQRPSRSQLMDVDMNAGINMDMDMSLNTNPSPKRNLKQSPSKILRYVESTMEPAYYEMKNMNKGKTVGFINAENHHDYKSDSYESVSEYADLKSRSTTENMHKVSNKNDYHTHEPMYRKSAQGFLHEEKWPSSNSWNGVSMVLSSTCRLGGREENEMDTGSRKKFNGSSIFFSSEEDTDNEVLGVYSPYHPKYINQMNKEKKGGENGTPWFPMQVVHSDAQRNDTRSKSVVLDIGKNTLGSSSSVRGYLSDAYKETKTKPEIKKLKSISLNINDDVRTRETEEGKAQNKEKDKDNTRSISKKKTHTRFLDVVENISTHEMLQIHFDDDDDDDDNEDHDNDSNDDNHDDNEDYNEDYNEDHNEDHNESDDKDENEDEDEDEDEKYIKRHQIKRKGTRSIKENTKRVSICTENMEQAQQDSEGQHITQQDKKGSDDYYEKTKKKRRDSNKIRKYKSMYIHKPSSIHQGEKTRHIVNRGSRASRRHKTVIGFEKRKMKNNCASTEDPSFDGYPDFNEDYLNDKIIADLSKDIYNDIQLIQKNYAREKYLIKYADIFDSFLNLKLSLEEGSRGTNFSSFYNTENNDPRESTSMGNGLSLGYITKKNDYTSLKSSVDATSHSGCIHFPFHKNSGIYGETKKHYQSPMAEFKEENNISRTNMKIEHSGNNQNVEDNNGNKEQTEESSKKESESDSKKESENDSKKESENDSKKESENDSKKESENDSKKESESDSKTESKKIHLIDDKSSHEEIQNIIKEICILNTTGVDCKVNSTQFYEETKKDNGEQNNSISKKTENENTISKKKYISQNNVTIPNYSHYAHPRGNSLSNYPILNNIHDEPIVRKINTCTGKYIGNFKETLTRKFSDSLDSVDASHGSIYTMPDKRNIQFSEKPKEMVQQNNEYTDNTVENKKAYEVQVYESTNSKEKIPELQESEEYVNVLKFYNSLDMDKYKKLKRTESVKDKKLKRRNKYISTNGFSERIPRRDKLVDFLNAYQKKTKMYKDVNLLAVPDNVYNIIPKTDKMGSKTNIDEIINNIYNYYKYNFLLTFSESNQSRDINVYKYMKNSNILQSLSIDTKNYSSGGTNITTYTVDGNRKIGSLQKEFNETKMEKNNSAELSNKHYKSAYFNAYKKDNEKKEPLLNYKTKDAPTTDLTPCHKIYQEELPTINLIRAEQPIYGYEDAYQIDDYINGQINENIIHVYPSTYLRIKHVEITEFLLSLTIFLLFISIIYDSIY